MNTLSCGRRPARECRWALMFVVVAAASLGRAQIAAWEVNGINASAINPFAATTLGAGLASAALELGPGVAASNAASTFGGSGFNQTSLAAAITGGDYLSIHLTPLAGQSLSLSSLTVLLGVSTAVTNFNVALESSATGFTSAAALWSFSFNNTTPPAQTVSFTGLGALQDLSSSVEFRFYGWRDTTGTTTFRLRNLTGDDLSFSGTTSAIPEPSACASLMGAMALLVLVVRASRRPRRQKLST
jgi:hypothetical protein